MTAAAFTGHAPYAARRCRAGAPLRAGGRLLAAYHALVLGVAVLAIYANLPIYGYVLEPALLPKFSFFAICLLFLPLALLRRGALVAYLGSPFVAWAGVVVLLNLIHLLAFPSAGELAGVLVVDQHIEARRALILTRTQYLLFAIVLGFGVAGAASRAWMAALVALALLLPCAVLLDFFWPGLLYPIATVGAVPGRAAAMFVNATMAGEALLLVAVLACVAAPPRWRTLLFMLAGCAVLTTFSRSSIIAWVVLFVILVASGTLPPSACAWLLVTAALALLSSGQFERYLDSRPEFDGAVENILSRLDFFARVAFTDDSSLERAQVVKASWELFWHNPVFGAGAGATQFWAHRGSTHNQLLLLAAEYGLFGLAWWGWLLRILWRARFLGAAGPRWAVLFLFVFMSLFTHQMFDAASYWLATFAIVACGAARGTR